MPDHAPDVQPSSALEQESLASYLARHEIKAPRTMHAARFLVGQLAEFKTPEEMLADLREAGLPQANLNLVQQMLTNDADLLDRASLDVLAAAWDEPGQHDLALGAIEESGARLPVVEVVAVVVAVMYGMWLRATGGRRSTKRTVKRKQDGSFIETESTEWYDATGPLRAVVDALRSATSLDSGSLPELPAPSDPQPAQLPQTSDDPDGQPPQT